MKRSLGKATDFLLEMYPERKKYNQVKHSVAVFLFDMYNKKEFVITMGNLYEYLEEATNITTDDFINIVNYLSFLTQEEITGLVIKVYKERKTYAKNREKYAEWGKEYRNRPDVKERRKQQAKEYELRHREERTRRAHENYLRRKAKANS